MKNLPYAIALAIFFLWLSSQILFSEKITGVDGKKWGTSYNAVLDFYRDVSSSDATKDSVEIINAIEDKEIIVKRNNILYKFVFYKTPQELLDLYKKIKDVSLKDTSEKGMLFFAEIRFSGVESNSIQEKLMKKYGNPTVYDSNTEASGFSFWKSKDGNLVQFNDVYKEKKYTSRLYYISPKYSDIIGKDLDSFSFLMKKKICTI